MIFYKAEMEGCSVQCFASVLHHQFFYYFLYTEKSYLDSEEDKRQMIWEENYRKVLKHNYEFDLGKQSYRLGLNRFSDMVRF